LNDGGVGDPQTLYVRHEVKDLGTETTWSGSVTEEIDDIPIAPVDDQLMSSEKSCSRNAPNEMIQC
jgi:hypothetical protein